NRPPIRPKLLVPDLEARWDAAVMRCLERSPSARFSTAPQVLEAIEGRAVLRIRRAPISALIALLAVGLAGAWMLRRFDWPRGGAARSRPSAAALGFKNLSGRAENAWVGTALAEIVSAELEAGGAIRVVPGEEVARARIGLSLAESDSYAKD